jgi:hypothetical protein
MKSLMFCSISLAIFLISCSENQPPTSVNQPTNNPPNNWTPTQPIDTGNIIITPPQATVDTFAPVGESKVPHYYVNYPTIPSIFSAGVAWAQAIDLASLSSTTPSKVEIDYLRLYGVYGTEKRLITSDEYNGSFNQMIGALRSRVPWCKQITPNDEGMHLPGKIENGILILDISSNKDKLWHWWGERLVIKPVPDYFIVETNIRLSAKACFQLGADAHLSAESIPNVYGHDLDKVPNATFTEIGASNWYGPKNDWQLIVFSSKK